MLPHRMTALSEQLIGVHQDLRERLAAALDCLGPEARFPEVFNAGAG